MTACLITFLFAANVLFEGDDEAISVPSIILDALKKVNKQTAVSVRGAKEKRKWKSGDKQKREIQIHSEYHIHTRTFIPTHYFFLLFSLCFFVSLQCPADTRYELARSLILAGGTCMLQGFKQRLLSELNNKVETDKEYTELSGTMSVVLLVVLQLFIAVAVFEYVCLNERTYNSLCFWC